MSSNPLDNIGDRFVGWNAAWVQRDKKIVFDLLDVRFGSLADLLSKFSLMSAFGGKADIELLDDGHKKGQHLPAFSVSIAL